MPKTVILGAARTPIGKMGGALSGVDATELGGTAITAALERAQVEPEQVQHVIMGQVIQAGQGQIPSRQAQIQAGIPKEVSSETVNKVCASGLRATVLLDQAIRAGDVEVVGGGIAWSSRTVAQPGGADLVDGLRRDLLGDAGLDLGLARGSGPVRLDDLAHDDVLDLLRLDLRALEGGGDRRAAQLRGVDAAEGAPILPIGARPRRG